MNRLVYLDTETTGLDPHQHHVWEIAWAVDDGPINTTFVGHSLVGADELALGIGGYWERFDHRLADPVEELELQNALEGATIVGANPAFDATFLTNRWGLAPWHYRLLDVEAYAMGALGLDRPAGLNKIAERLTAAGATIPTPDHTAAGDVDTVRHAHRALASIYGAGQLVTS